MPSNTKKPLYLGTSVDDLQKLGEVEIGKREDPEKHLKVAEKAFTKAEELWIEGDEEKSFVLFMRYLNSIENAKRTLAYSKSPNKFSGFISKDKFLTSISRAELLKESLKNRYAERREAEAKLCAVDEIEDSPSCPVAEIEAGPFISPGELLPLLTARPPTAVIVDCRSVRERDRGMVTALPYLQLPTDRPLLSHSLADIKSFLSAVQLPIRGVLLVLMDACSQEITTPRDAPLLQFRDSLSKFDTDGQLSVAPRILDGGYEAWTLHYPAYSAVYANQSAGFTPPGDDVIFPTIDSPPPKPKEDFFKPRRAPPPTPASRPTHESSPPQDPAVGPLRDNDVTNTSLYYAVREKTKRHNMNTKYFVDIEFGVSCGFEFGPMEWPSLSYAAGNDVNDNTRFNSALPDNDVTTESIAPYPDGVLVPSAPPNGQTYNHNIYIPTAILAPRLPYPDNSLSNERPDFLANSLPPKPAGPSILSADPSILPADLSILPADLSILPADPSILSADLSILSAGPSILPADLSILSADPSILPADLSILPADLSILSADLSILSAGPSARLPQVPPRPDHVSELMGRELEDKNRRLRALETELREKEVLEDKIKSLERQVSVEQRGVEAQKRQMLQEIANEKFQADRELGERERHLAEMEEQTKLKLKLEKESISQDKARIVQAKNFLDQEKKQVELGKQELERDKLEFERVKRAVLEQQKLAQESQAANPSHQFTTGRTEPQQMQLNHGLPPGWRKLFDSSTGRFYYQDDSTKTTHWNPPTSWIVSQQPNIMQGKTKGALLSSFQQPPSDPTPTPKIDRTTKPAEARTPEIPSRATKHPSLTNPYYAQILARIQAKSKSRVLDPTHGGQGPVLTGLKNLGNTCFMNSILQCLTAAYPLAEYFITQRFVHHVNPVNPLGMGGEIAEEFAFLVQTLWRGSYKSVAPRDFKNVLSKFAPQFSGSQQHDSQEFLAFLLDGLHEDLNKVMRKEYIQEQDNLGIPDQKASQISWENHLKRNDSIIVDLFQGQFKSTLTCLQCGFTSVTFEAFMYLSVPIPSSPHVTLIDCVRQFTKAERVSGSNSWFCARCKAHRDSAKQLQVWRLPPILLIHLKRFSFVGKWKQKLDTNVSFPLSGLDLSTMSLGPLQPMPYQLFAVSNHTGTLDGGHYTAFVRHAINKKFYTFDDSVVRDMSSSSVMTKNGYMLFYTSVDFTPKLKL